MPSPEEMRAEKERLYESSSLRDDFNDAEATVLLQWGEGELERLAESFPDEFEQKARFLRQLIKNINRFVGQREFNEMRGQAQYMSKIVMYLEPLGWTEVRSDDLFAALPEDKADMAANLDALLGVLSPQSDSSDSDSSGEPDPHLEMTEIDANSIVDRNKLADEYTQELENSSPHKISHDENDNLLGDSSDYGEE